MGKLNIGIVFFSGTHVTKSCAEAVGGELVRLGCSSRLHDVTAFSARRAPFPVREYDALIFGAPVYADFPPSVLDGWLSALEGGGKPCATFVTYGGRTPGHAHYHLFRVLSGAGFGVRLSAEFLGRHTFNLAGWKLLPERPDERDFAAAREFAGLARQRFDSVAREAFSLPKPSGYEAALKSNRETLPAAERRWAQPVRVKDCSLCGLCETECPAQAMDARSGESDPAKCIECLHCVFLCPEQALKADERLGAFFPEFLKEHNLTEEVLRKKSSRIIAATEDATA
jgi:NAD-dependent dihydropyrimidine dehydrogenase PreA subunit